MLALNPHSFKNMISCISGERLTQCLDFWTGPTLSDVGKDKLSSHKSPSKPRLLQLLLLPLLPEEEKNRAELGK